MLDMTIIFGISNLCAIIFGWWVVDKLSERRERMADLRQLAQYVVKDVEQIENLALIYHTNKARDFEMEETILKLLERMEAKIQILSRQLKSINLSLVISLRKSITIKNFQTNSFQVQPRNSKLLNSINAASTQIIEQLYLAH